ncbi:hypothetical protein SAMN05421541_11769 [Actinoplanes philippinensis]|uniref:Uncharacterized protein n=1 Tax=Actinoplanes philippinensis TaxID=35752 RepID=A0A1I2KJ77_9ACTN|nr:hypothetical protein [Actinoplanes philippinensis]SFF67014.1 hypothetical protein SAMN05421541_11769 [Actinoplanes philippinensis]
MPKFDSAEAPPGKSAPEKKYPFGRAAPPTAPGSTTTAPSEA